MLKETIRYTGDKTLRLFLNALDNKPDFTERDFIKKSVLGAKIQPFYNHDENSIVCIKLFDDWIISPDGHAYNCIIAVVDDDGVIVHPTNSAYWQKLDIEEYARRKK